MSKEEKKAKEKKELEELDKLLADMKGIFSAMKIAL